MGDIPKTVADTESWRNVRHADEKGTDLTQWEIDFIESLTKQLLDGRRLSHKQKDRLEQIIEDRCD